MPRYLFDCKGVAGKVLRVALLDGMDASDVTHDHEMLTGSLVTEQIPCPGTHAQLKILKAHAGHVPNPQAIGPCRIKMLRSMNARQQKEVL